MLYHELIETVSLIVENEKIKKDGLTLLYKLPEFQFNSINKAIFHKANPYSTKFDTNESINEFEVMLGGILVKFKKV